MSRDEILEGQPNPCVIKSAAVPLCLEKGFFLKNVFEET